MERVAACGAWRGRRKALFMVPTLWWRLFGLGVMDVNKKDFFRFQDFSPVGAKET